MDIDDDPVLRRLIDQVQTARAARGVLDLRGGNTKAFYGGAQRGDPLDLRVLSGISSYEPSELVVTVRAGTPLAELEAALAERGQHLAFEPPRFGAGGTVGGMLAAGLSGPARATAGAARDHVLGLTMLNGRGEVLSFGGQVMKNVAGYDLPRLLVGSMGVLGAILEASLKVLPQPVASATLAFECGEADALERLQRWGGEPLPISASAWQQGRLELRLSGARAAVDAACRRLGGERLADAAARWDALRDQTAPFFAEGGAPLWRVSVPAHAAPLALPGEPLIEWGGALRWWRSDASAAAIRAAAAQAGGHATLYRAADKSAPAFTPLPDPLLAIQRRLKQSFDPDAVFNPARLGL